MKYFMFSALAGLVAVTSAGRAGTLQFNRDIRPILSENCFHCHGQDASKRKAELRLDTAEGARALLEKGAALVPGQPDKSLLLQRMMSHDPDELMPPPESKRSVTEEQIRLVSQWISEGGEYENHWAFVPPAHPAMPAATAWDRQPWDALVRARLEREGMQPSAAATPAAWLRRATFDLTGFAPTTAELDAFEAAVAAKGEAAFSEAADRLLANAAYGERMAAEWLDVARYADTHGFNNDSARSMWRWRDWVIDAFNRNLRYDQFITKQLAGDLLPNPALEDKIATGFGRNHVINSEGGIIDEEYRVEYVADRVRTLGMAWLGLTMECSRCHDHKYDPVTAKDYYRLYAFFNQVPEWGEDGRVANASPLIPAPTKAQREHLSKLEQGRSALAAGRVPGEMSGKGLGEVLTWLRTSVPVVPELPENTLRLENKDGKWINAVKPGQAWGKGPDPTAAAAGMHFPAEGDWKLDGAAFDASSNKPWTWQSAVRWEGGEGVLLSSMDYTIVESSTAHGNGFEIRITAEGRPEVRMAQKWPAYAIQAVGIAPLAKDRWHHVAVVNHGTDNARGFRIFVDGVESAVEVLHDGLSGGMGAKAMRMGSATGKNPDAFHGSLEGMRAWSRVLTSKEIVDLADSLWVRSLPEGPAGSEAALGSLERLQGIVRRHDAGVREQEEKWLALRSGELEAARDFPTVMVMSELSAPRPTHVLMRGNYDAPGEPVTPGVPESLLGAWPEGAPRNRLGLAQWLTKADHPLTARVVVNRFWQQVFGTGLVKTSEDFGIQSEYPAHKEVLDELARNFIESGWNVKALMKSLVLSATYRQDSRVGADLLAKDPANRLLARGPRVRLSAEMIRDHALAVSGLLKPRIGGPGVYPDQPPDLYKGVVVDAAYPGTKWTNSQGDDLYRRSLYTFWKRTVPHPVMTVFDMPDREFGCVRRSRTNTPLQALTLMNEPALVRAAGHLGARIRGEGGATDAEKLTFGFRLVASRQPSEKEAAVLARMLEGLRKSYQSDPTGAGEMLKSADVVPAAETAAADLAEAAAWTALASNLLNLDETITKN
ncbi:MAG: hypothetical protein JWL81_3417 [Verrucomicrobiales bacterium]|nr:hypothetical protein [Verrucomicrobiales bacterium]